jgi:hypothetical protein
MQAAITSKDFFIIVLIIEVIEWLFFSIDTAAGSLYRPAAV